MDVWEQKAARTVWNSERTVWNSREVILAASFEQHFDCHKVDDVRTSSFMDAWEQKAAMIIHGRLGEESSQDRLEQQAT